MQQLFSTIPQYKYEKTFQKVQFGTFLKSPIIDAPGTQNFDEFLRKIQEEYQLEYLVALKQVHSDLVHVVDNKFLFKEKMEGDGLITNLQRVGLIALHADCQVAFFFDSVQKVIGVIHAGFRGQIKKIYSNAVSKFVKVFRTNPQDLQVVFSPSLCENHAEFVHYKEEFPIEFWKYKNPQNCFNLKLMAKEELLSLGLKEENIWISPDCTMENEEIFYSYRSQKTAKRHVSFIFFNPNA